MRWPAACGTNPDGWWALGGTVFLTVEVAFFLANLTKITHGGWLPLLVAAAVFTVLLTWQRGRIIVTRNRTREEGPLLEFVEHLRTLDPPVHRVPGTTVFLNANPDTTPLALRANVEHNHVLQQRVIIMHIQVRNVPHVPDSDRLTSDNLGFDDDGISGLNASFGFQDEPNVPATLRLAVKTGHLSAQDLEEVTYFLSRITLVQSTQRNMATWRKKLFLAISRNSAHPVAYFGLPISRSISMGEQIPL